MLRRIEDVVLLPLALLTMGLLIVVAFAHQWLRKFVADHSDATFFVGMMAALAIALYFEVMVW